jgi:hypothetical protein
MSYVYLFDLYDMIDQRLEHIELSQDSKSYRFSNGRKDVLMELKTYLERQLNPKLPRAIQRKLKES